MFELYWEYYVMGIILLPGIIFAAYAQARVSSTYNKYSQVLSQKGVKSQELARILLDCANLNNIEIQKIQGKLTDYYDPRNNLIALSSSTYNSSSIAALGVTAHEVGHALQYKDNYLPIKIRSFIIPLSNFLSRLLWPLVIIGFIFNFAAMPGSIIGDIFLWVGVGFFGIAILLDLITLPVEYNASNRALKILQQSEVLNEEETKGAREMLNAAAMTYVASLLNSILNLVRFLAVFFMHKKRD